MSAKALLSASVSAATVYVEDVFSTYLYTGNGSTQTITNGIDLDGEGGLVWIMSRASGVGPVLFDTNRGVSKFLQSNNTSATLDYPGYGVTSFGSSGFTVFDTSTGSYGVNGSSGPYGGAYASWTFRKAEKFFDVVTWTGDATPSKVISHNLGATPGCIIVKSVNDPFGNWNVYHRSNSTNLLRLNLTDAAVVGPYWDTPTSTTFTAKGAAGINYADTTYVAYLFAHDAGGFGDAGTDSVVSCGSYTGNGSSTGPVIDLGWEPQWLLVKQSSISGANWVLIDNMRGFTADGVISNLYANLSDSEVTGITRIAPLPNGFQPRFSGYEVNQSGQTYIYIAIRRGPMRAPTSGTEVFATVAATGSTGTSRSIGFPSDFLWARNRGFTYAPVVVDRLRGYSATSGGSQPALETTNTGAENPFTTAVVYDVWNDTVKDGVLLGSTSFALWYHFRRAPGFFDVVAYTGTGANRTVSHNLGVAPELIIVKRRNTSGAFWAVQNFANGATKGLYLNGTEAAFTTSSYWNNTSPTASVFTVGTNSEVNGSSNTYITYLFATAPGVSKVGSYTGTGTTLNVDCGFTAGARFVLIKRTDSTGDWYVWDTARGIISGDDPYLLLNSTAAEVTNTDYIDPLSSGFQISSTAPAAINASGGSFIFLAIA